jgi:hypothetical protein
MCKRNKASVGRGIETLFRTSEEQNQIAAYHSACAIINKRLIASCRVSFTRWREYRKDAGVARRRFKQRREEEDQAAPKFIRAALYWQPSQWEAAEAAWQVELWESRFQNPIHSEEDRPSGCQVCGLRASYATFRGAQPRVCEYCELECCPQCVRTVKDWRLGSPLLAAQCVFCVRVDWARSDPEGRMSYAQFAAIEPFGFPVHRHGRVWPLSDDHQDWKSSECSDQPQEIAPEQSSEESYSREVEPDRSDRGGMDVWTVCTHGPHSPSDADSSAGPPQVREQTEGELAEEGKNTKSGMGHNAGAASGSNPYDDPGSWGAEIYQVQPFGPIFPVAFGYDAFFRSERVNSLGASATIVPNVPDRFVSIVRRESLKFYSFSVTHCHTSHH